MLHTTSEWVGERDREVEWKGILIDTYIITHNKSDCIEKQYNDERVKKVFFAKAQWNRMEQRYKICWPSKKALGVTESLFAYQIEY